MAIRPYVTDVLPGALVPNAASGGSRVWLRGNARARPSTRQSALEEALKCPEHLGKLFLSNPAEAPGDERLMHREELAYLDGAGPGQCSIHKVPSTQGYIPRERATRHA